MPKKTINIRHMEEIRNDHVAQFLNKNNIEQLHVNPAHGVPLPADNKDYDAVIIYGGIQSANDGFDKPYITEELDWISDWLASGRPVLGICLGAQLLAKCLGGEVGTHPEHVCEVGFHEVTPTSQANGFLDAPMHFYQWHSEGFTLPDDCELLAEGSQFPNQAFRYQSNTYGIQFHPEITHSIMKTWLMAGSHLLSNSGAHCADQQIEDESFYGENMGRWCWNFMENWMKTW